MKIWKRLHPLKKALENNSKGFHILLDVLSKGFHKWAAAPDQMEHTGCLDAVRHPVLSQSDESMGITANAHEATS